jgi:hypothetical protein
VQAVLIASGAPHRVDATAAVQQIDLLADLLIRRAEPRAQQLCHMAAQRLVPWPAGKRTHQFGQPLAAPGSSHDGTMRQRVGFRQGWAD